MEMSLQSLCKISSPNLQQWTLQSFSQSSLRFRGVTRVFIMPGLAANSDPKECARRSLFIKTKGFARRQQVETRAHKKDICDENKWAESSTSDDYTISSNAVVEREIVDGPGNAVNLSPNSIISSNALRDIVDGIEDHSKDDDEINKRKDMPYNLGKQKVHDGRLGETATTKRQSAIAETVKDESKRLADTQESTQDLDSIWHYKGELEGHVKQVLEKCAEENFSKGNKLFFIPQIANSDRANADRVIEIFINRSLSTLMDDPNMVITGAFNGWRWKNFTERLHKCNFSGDWWSCSIYVPKEAYRIDFVFSNGNDVYDNNNSKDYCILVEGGMDEYAFEKFLLEEKCREPEKLAAKQAQEQCEIDAEKTTNETDKAHTKVELDRKRQRLQNVINLARQSVENVWLMEPSSFEGGDTVQLYYNRSSRPLAHATEIWIHGGQNNWDDGLTIVEKLFPSDKLDGDWWFAEVVVPKRALVLDWVFADGPPGKVVNFDNNNGKDFHAIVPKSLSEELFWAEEEHRVYRKIQEDRRLREEVARGKAEKIAQMKAETKEKTTKMFLLSRKHIVYTEPLDVRAGSTVSVLYNPAYAILNGKPEVWLRHSFNRWTHSNGPFPPQKMVAAGNSPYLKATVKVPMDAYMMDFVFSESEDGGAQDNRNGMGYHVPVAGGTIKEPPMHIVHIAVEMAPIAKVGGLGDVVTSLSRAVQELGHKVDIILPKYNCINTDLVKDLHYHQSFGWGGTEIKVWVGKVMDLSVHFLEPQNGMFSVGCIYGGNDGHRFAFFCHAALEFLLQSGPHPDILHCHDWSSAPITWLAKEHYKSGALSNARVIFTVHNLEFGIHQVSRAMTFADKATTVSPTYSKEVARNPSVAPHLGKFHGILNGIDPDIWDPYNDNFIPVPYTSENVIEGKKAAKEALQQKLGLGRFDLPLVGIISRLTFQKGIHLIKHAISQTLEHNGQVVLLGSAPDCRIQHDFVNLANQLHNTHNDRVRFCLTYDESLSHLIYAGADFILVPSLFEPCGLAQLIAMRYGSIPVVRRTGGLYDTVFDIDNDKERAQAQGLEPNGFSFGGADLAGVEHALNRAISVWFNERERFNTLCKRVMEQNWSWNRPALDYIELYHAARSSDVQHG